MSLVPSITATLVKTLELFTRSYLFAAPYVLLIAVITYLLSKAAQLWGQQDTGITPRAIILFFALYLGSFLIHCCTMYAIYQLNQHKNVNYVDATVQAIKRFIPMILAVTIILLMCLIIGGFFIFIPYMAFAFFKLPLTLYSPQFFVMIGLYVLTIILMITLFVHYMLVELLVVCKNLNPIAGLKRSWQLISQNAWYGFLLLLIINIPYVALTWGITYFNLLPQIIINPLLSLFFTPFNICLMIIIYQRLEKQHR